MHAIKESKRKESEPFEIRRHWTDSKEKSHFEWIEIPTGRKTSINSPEEFGGDEEMDMG